ncbi:transcriptional regulator [Pseudoduganella flava]|uniref:Transcriptional regulator n=1 Tax=Pseudoduganella flava TaxID=871742 RepID=A0A562PQL8_9BURK|nr:YafY family protein [Pseudoduganella flava]QGZ37868.1 WYL domain-containing protein [Pseudoduganella flava]TWI46699.1 transcriptional regulator [Pseudoduganella flava]
MYHPTTRVLAVLELLQTHGRLSGTELASRLGVDGRTLRRYIVMLEELGIPVTAERGRYGGYALMPGFKLPPMMFTDDEALALAVGLLAARSLGLADSTPAVASAQAKLERIMPDGLRRRVGAVDASVRLDLARGTAPGSNDALAALSAAAQARQRVRLTYRAPAGDVTEREFDPYGLAYYLGFWYVAGMCHLRADLRTLRLDRVVQVRPLVRAFVRPEGFDPLAHVRSAVATVPRAFSATVLLKTDVSSARASLPGYMGVLEQAEDGVLLRSEADELPWLARQLAALPFPFEVVHPPALCAAVREHAVRLLQTASVG